MNFEFTGLTKVVSGITLRQIRRLSGEVGGWIEKESNLETQVSGGAWVSGDARVSGDAWETSPLQIQGSAHHVTNCRYGFIKIGCIELSFAEWSSQYKAIGRGHGYSEEQIAEYGAIIQLICKFGK